jgi:hypothetical protein
MFIQRHGAATVISIALLGRQFAILRRSVLRLRAEICCSQRLTAA